MPDGQDIGYAVTVTLPDRYFTAELYVVVPGGSEDPEDAAREWATRTLRSLVYIVPEAKKLEITAVRRVS